MSKSQAGQAQSGLSGREDLPELPGVDHPTHGFAVHIRLPQLVFGHLYSPPLYFRRSGLFPMGVAQVKPPRICHNTNSFGFD